MPALKLKAELTGVGAVNNCYMYFERFPAPDFEAVPIGLRAKNASRKEWSNASLSIDVEGDLDFQLNVNALRGTGWSFKLSAYYQNKWNKIYETEGETGSNPDRGRNVSIVRDSVIFN